MTEPRRVRTQVERAADDHAWRAGDHPHADPGDGRTECDRCGKYVWPAIHSCKGVPVTSAARGRLASAKSGTGRGASGAGADQGEGMKSRNDLGRSQP